MKWKSFMTPVENLEPEEARAYMRDHAEGDYTLLDVRQPGEYAKQHIPAAVLIPLPDLSNRIGELDSKKPVLAYCAVGGRSRAAAQYLSGQGFSSVLNLKGGIKAWNGVSASGGEDEGMTGFRGDETVPEMLTLAYAMEHGLADFYRTLAEHRDEQDVLELLYRLASIEDLHRERIWSLYRAHEPQGVDRQAFESGGMAEVMEGGFTTAEFLSLHEAEMSSLQGVLSMAMMLEAQALDLYSRYAHKSEDATTRDVLLQIADEEKEHLEALGRLLDDRASS